jgi:hypothetical protein
VVVGAGGAGGPASNTGGSNGAASSFGTFITCPGGNSGVGNAVFVPTTYGFAAFGAGAAAACTFTGVTTTIASIPGAASAYGSYWGVGTIQQAAGAGASSGLGIGGASTLTFTENQGAAGSGYGWGVSGTALIASQPAMGGAAGGGGAVIIYEFN